MTKRISVKKNKKKSEMRERLVCLLFEKGSIEQL